MDPETGEPIPGLLTTMREVGIDEIAQLENVLRGEMDIAGPRPLIRDEYVEFRDHISGSHLSVQYDRIVVPVKKGIVSTFGNGAHFGFPEGTDQFIARAECDIKDVVDDTRATLTHDFALMGQLVVSAARSKLNG